MDARRRKAVAEELEAIFQAAGAREVAKTGEKKRGLLGLFGKPKPLVDPSTGGALVYAVGDVHGQYDLLKDLLAQIARDCVAEARGRRPILVFCGDYVDRGPASAEVVEAVVWLKNRSDLTVRALKGNHEQAMLAFIDEPAKNMNWLSFGGLDTLVSYGVGGSMDDERNRRQAARELAARLPATHDQLLRNLELAVEVGDYAFVHAGIRRGVPLKKQKEEHLLWIRKGFLDDEDPHERIIVHGHSWKGAEPQVLANRIGIDTGAYSTGVLTALRLDGTNQRFLHARRRAS